MHRSQASRFLHETDPFTGQSFDGFAVAIGNFGSKPNPVKPTFQLDEASKRFWRETRNKYVGKRGFVIGNGPSLRVEDLDRLQREVCIASNKIFLAFERTSWRPTLFTVVDDQIWNRTASELHKYVPQVCIQSYLKPQSTGPLTVITMRDLGNAADMARSSSKIIPFSSDVGAGVYGGYTVTYENLQLAVHLGLNPIYLLAVITSTRAL